MPLVKPVVKIENVVATAALKHPIDLKAVMKAFPEVRYRPGQFPGLIFQLTRPRTTTLIFGTGKMVCTGARSEGNAVKALRKVVSPTHLNPLSISAEVRPLKTFSFILVKMRFRKNSGYHI